MENILNLIYEILVHMFLIFIVEIIIFYLFLKNILINAINSTVLSHINNQSKEKKNNIKTILNNQNNKIRINYIHKNEEKIIINKNNQKIIFLIVIMILIIILLIIIISYISNIYNIKLHLDYVQLISSITLLFSLELILIFEYNLKIKHNSNEIISIFLKKFIKLLNNIIGLNFKNNYMNSILY